MDTDLVWLENLIEKQYGISPTNELRRSLSSSWARSSRAIDMADLRTHGLRRLIDELVIGETYFFREMAQIEFLKKRLFTSHFSDIPNTRTVRILSAGCSSGEEAYSLAMALDSLGETIASRIAIVGVDVSGTAIRKARKGEYSAWSLRATPAEIRETYFHERAGNYVLNQRFRAHVTFEERNLFEEDDTFWAPCAFDVIFCRNVGIYLSPRAWQDLIARFSHILVPGGSLFIGHSETARGFSSDFELEQVGDVFHYLRKDAKSIREPARILEPPAPTSRRPTTDIPPSSSESKSRFTGTNHASERRRSLSLMEAERFDEALDIISEFTHEPWGVLHGAVVAMARGRFEQTEIACRALISAGDYRADAHCLLGSCREHAQAFDSAEHHYREAAKLDPHFGMPHLRLGILLHRSGDIEGGCVALEHAMPLVEHESAERIILFGGGFSRSVLLGLCREMLARCID